MIQEQLMILDIIARKFPFDIGETVKKIENIAKYENNTR